MDEVEVTRKLKRDFRSTFCLHQIDDSSTLIVFSSVMDGELLSTIIFKLVCCLARHTVRNAQKFAPLSISTIDDPDASHLFDYAKDNREKLKPFKKDFRPATNMSAVRNLVSRHLNIRPTNSPQAQMDKEVLSKAREAKEAKSKIWD